MSRAAQILEDVRRDTRPQMYRCINNKCGSVELSPGLRPQDAMQGLGAACASCGSKTEAISGHTTLPGGIINPSSRKGMGESAADKLRDAAMRLHHGPTRDAAKAVKKHVMDKYSDKAPQASGVIKKAKETVAHHAFDPERTKHAAIGAAAVGAGYLGARRAKRRRDRRRGSE